MALQKQYWETTFGQAGRMSRQDEKVLESPNLLELINGEITAPGRIQKRHGYVSHESDQTDDYGLETSGRATNGTALVAIGDYAVNTYNTKTEWSNDATAMIPVSDVHKLIGTPAEAWSMPDMAHYNSYYFVIANNGADWFLFVFDSNYNQVAKVNVVTDTNPAKIIKHYYGIDIFYWDSGGLYGVRVSQTDLTLGTPVNVGAAAEHATVRYFDVCTDGTDTCAYCYLSYSTNNPGVRTIKLNSSLSTVDAYNKTTYGAGNNALATHYNTELDKILVVFCLNGTDSYYIQYDTDVTEEYAATLWGATAAAYAENFVIGSLSDRWIVYSHHPLSGTSITDPLDSAVVCVYIQGSTRSRRSMHFSVGFAHKALERLDSHGPFWGVSRTQDDFSQYYTLEFRGTDDYFSEPIAKYMYRLTSAIGTGYTEQGYVPNCIRLADSKTFGFVAQVADQYNQYAIALCTFSYKNSGDTFQRRFHYARVKNDLILSGSVPIFWDGSIARECGFSHPPAIVDDTVGGGGSMADGDYSYVVVYILRDKNGRVYKSQVSAPYAVSVSGMGGSGDVTLKFTPGIFRPDWDSERDELRELSAFLYRTEDSGTIYYELPIGFSWSSQVAWFCQSISVTALPTFTDTATDASIIGYPTLYTTGDVLEQCGPPPFDHVAFYDNRIWGIDSETGDIYYSAEMLEGEGPWFNAVFCVTSPIDIGKPKALVDTQSFLMVFYENAIGAIYGQGYNILGTDGNLTSVKIIVNGIGVSEQKSIAKIPGGIIFKSSSGFHIIGYDGSPPQYIGGGVSDYDDSVVVSADVVNDKKHVRFVLSGTDDPILVYNYEFNQWYVWGLDIGGQWCTKSGGTVVDNNHYIVNADTGNTLVQDTGYLDGMIVAAVYGEYDYGMVITTPWIKLTGLQGFQRVLKAWILGTFESDHDMVVQIDYDYDDSNTDTITITDLSTEIGEDLYQVRIGIPVQRCQAIRFRITIDTSSYSEGAGATLTGLRLEYMAKRGGMRSPNFG